MAVASAGPSGYSHHPEYVRRFDKARKITGYRAMRDGTIQRRKLRALIALGFTSKWIAEQMGRTERSFGYTLRDDWRLMHVDTIRLIDELYARYHMRVPQGWKAERCRARAQQLGYAPPLAWEDIEDINEEPKGLRVP